MARYACKHCIESKDYVPLAPGVLAAAAIVFVAAMSGNPVGALVAVLAGYWALSQVCDYLRGGKLICLKKDQCVIGLIVDIEPVGYHKFLWEKIDNDYSVNLFLAPHLVPSHEDDFPSLGERGIKNDGLQGHLITRQPESDLHFISGDLTYSGYHANAIPHDDSVLYHDQPVLHCEFEGNRVCDFCDAAKAAVAVATGAGILCAIPIIGWVACAVGAVVVGVLLLVGWFGAHDGDPSDVAVNPKDGHLNTGDYVVIKGDWVYDAAHEGWNEIHPVNSVQKIVDSTGLLSPNPPWKEGNTDPIIKEFKDNFLSVWCGAIATAESALVGDQQRKPENRWDTSP